MPATSIFGFIFIKIFPLFLAFIFPRAARIAPLLTGLFFIYWKSPWSDSFILLYNKCAPIPITRTVDYTDLVALVVLPLSYHLIRTIDRMPILRMEDIRFRWLILPCSFVFMATSPPAWWRTQLLPKGDIYIGKSYRTKLTPEQVLDTLRKEGYAPRLDTSYHPKYATDTTHYYIIEHIPLPNMSDTLKSIQFQLTGDKTGSSIHLNNINLGHSVNLGDWRLLKHFSKWYRRAVQEHIIQELH